MQGWWKSVLAASLSLRIPVEDEDLSEEGPSHN